MKARADDVWFEVEERIDASPANVFQHFTDPELYVRWMGAEASLDPHPGGVYRVRMSPDTVAVGEFVAVEPFHRIVFTFGWEGNDEIPPGSTTVEITLDEDEGATVLRLRHSGLPDEAARTMHAEGWTMYVGQLAQIAPMARSRDPES